jgi:sn-glycerol 3-phosphate transport system permease protein
MTTIVMATTQMLSVMDGIPDWSNVMTTAMLALLPPVIVVVVMQRLFIKGLIETEK